MRKAINWNEVKERLQRTQAAIETSLHSDAARNSRIYAERATRLAKRKSDAAPEAGFPHVLIFALGADRFAVELSEITEVLPLRKLTPVPSADAELLGVFNLRGEIVPIIGLARVLNLAHAAHPDSGYVLMLRRQECEVGLKVDQVSQIKRIPPAEVLPQKEIPGERSKSYFKGITRDATLILGIDELLTHAVFNAA